MRKSVRKATATPIAIEALSSSPALEEPAPKFSGMVGGGVGLWVGASSKVSLPSLSPEVGSEVVGSEVVGAQVVGSAGVGDGVGAPEGADVVGSTVVGD